MKKHDYIDNCLISLKRTYSKDETVSVLNKKLSEVELELGKANTYISELEEMEYTRNKELSDENDKVKDYNRRLLKKIDKLENEAILLKRGL